MRLSSVLVMALALGACHEEPTIVIKFEPNDLSAPRAHDGGAAKPDLARPRDGGAPDGGAKAAPKAEAPKLDAKALACKADSDCVAIAVDCCDCAGGGSVIAVAKAERAKLLAARDKRCKATACAMMMSTDASCAKKPACEKAHCILK